MQKPLFQKVEWIAMVVPDAMDAARLMCETYGIGPWKIVQYSDAANGNTKFVPLAGEAGAYLSAVCTLPGGIGLDFITPLQGESCYARFLRENGPGIHHLTVDGDYDACLEAFSQAGYQPEQISEIDGKELRAVVPHQDIMGSALEVRKQLGDSQLNPEPLEELIPDGSTAPLFDYFDQIGIVVPDVMKAAHVLNDLYGVGPHILLTFGEDRTGTYRPGECVCIEDVIFNGEKVEHFGSVALLSVGDSLNIQLEIMEPTTREGIHYECLRATGGMTQHLCMKQSLPYDEIKRRMDEAGYTRGQVCTVDTVETCLYSDHMEIFGFYLEAHKRPEDFTPPKVKFGTYPPDIDIEL